MNKRCVAQIKLKKRLGLIRPTTPTPRGRRRGGTGIYAATRVDAKRLEHFYGVRHRYVKALVRKLVKCSSNPTLDLVTHLESRVQTCLMRANFGSIDAVRFLLSHEHITVNGSVAKFPSMRLKVGDRIEVCSRSSGHIRQLIENSIVNPTFTNNEFLSLDPKKLQITLIGSPKNVHDVNFGECKINVSNVILFYKK